MKKIDVNDSNTRKVVIEVPKTVEYILVQYTYIDEYGVRQAGIDSFRPGQEAADEAE